MNQSQGKAPMLEDRLAGELLDRLNESILPASGGGQAAKDEASEYLLTTRSFTSDKPVTVELYDGPGGQLLFGPQSYSVNSDGRLLPVIDTRDWPQRPLAGDYVIVTDGASGVFGNIARSMTGPQDVYKIHTFIQAAKQVEQLLSDGCPRRQLCTYL